ncbi:YbaB/EbfC family nucleoid-associated protein [candidate division KSB1 bacterium]|nr:MAG: YbaB/EbfC family nucleoid-associated protein [candidate division KSB1 bacterium]
MKKNMAAQFGMLQKLQKEMEELQTALEKMTVEGSAGGGMVTAVATGKQKLVSVKIDPEVVDENDVEMLEDLITAAVNQALDKSRELANEEMQKIAGGLLGGLPGGLNIPGMGL